MTTRRNSLERSEGDREKTRPTVAQAFGEEVWRIVDEAGEDGAIRETILAQMTESQFERAKGFIRDYKALSEKKSFLAFRGAYVTTTDPNRTAEYIGWRLRGVDRELSRMLSGAIDPLGNRVQTHAVLSYYQRQIRHMLETVEDMRKLGFPVHAMPARTKMDRPR